MSKIVQTVLDLDDAETNILVLLILKYQEKYDAILNAQTDSPLCTSIELLQCGLSLWELQQLLNLSYLTIYKVLHDLKEKNLIKQSPKNYHRYQISDLSIRILLNSLPGLLKQENNDLKLRSLEFHQIYYL
ncbi:MAG: hypothetical protein ACFE95_11520 [Candidatus Hodarchaeota archaeon]